MDIEGTSRGHSGDIPPTTAQDMTRATNQDLIRELGHLLQHLYDPLELGHSPLIERFGLHQRVNPGSALQEALIAAIQSLKPAPSAPSQANWQRLYHILLYRFVEQLPQKEVAQDLGLSIRQLRRLEDDAITLLAETLERRYDQPGASNAAAKDITAQTRYSRNQELDWLRKTTPSESVELRELIESVRQTAEPALRATGVSLVIRADRPVNALCQVTPLRQALLNLITTACQSATDKPATIRTETQAARGRAFIYLHFERPNTPDDQHWQESIAITEQLLSAFGGVLTAERRNSAHRITISLPLAEQATILAIDDNPDALQWLERALAGSRYRLIGATSPEQGIALAAQFSPWAIVLDVMMPSMDGWEALGRLRAHPATAHIPIIVTTILPQESLALALGAAAFLRKPISRETLLATLDAASQATPTAPE